jgi:hypothetical protein
LISTTFFSILVNGSPSPTFSPSHGIQGRPSLTLPLHFDGGRLRQGHQGRRSGARKLEGTLSSWEEKPTMHQQFVDDTMLMATPTVKEALKIKQVLQDFSDASGMCINKEKSQLFFFNTPQPIQCHLTRILGYQQCKLPSKYLGVPLTENSLKKKAWEDLLENMEKKLG